jgi:hypothetical protein
MISRQINAAEPNEKQEDWAYAMVAELTKPRRISPADLEETRRSFPGEVLSDKARETFTLAVSVVRHFFGHQWFMDHIFQDAEGSRPDGFMRIDYTPGPKGELKTSRLLDFAENLFNLQHIEGFDDRVEQMRTGSIEATFAEFDFARFLYIHDIDFQVRQGLRYRRQRLRLQDPIRGWT